MKIAIKQTAAMALVAIVMLVSNTAMFPAPVSAQVSGGGLICSIFPFLSGLNFGGASLCDKKADGSQAISSGISLVRLSLQLVFVGIIVIAIYIIIRAAIKYIRSEGEEGKIQEAQKAIKSVFIGIAALFIGIIGIVIILAFFNASIPDATDDINNIAPPGFIPTN